MSSTKEHRIGVIESGSPLSHHSLNQRKIRSADEGERKFINSLADQPIPSTVPERKTVYVETPLNQEFLDQLSPFMVELAQQRERTEENLAIPARIINSAIDVNRIFVQAKKKDIQTQMVNPVNLSDITFPTRRNDSQYPNLFPFQIFTARFKQMSNWRYLSEFGRSMLTYPLPKAYIINLTSTDFRLEAEDAVKERLETYGYTLASIGTALYFFPYQMAEMADFFFPMFLDISRKYIRR